MRYAAWVKTGEKSRRQQKAYAPARSINIARPVLAFVIAGLTVSMTVSAAELSISKDYPVGPNVDDSGQKNIKVSAEKTTLLDVGVHGKSPWSIVEKTASVDGTFDNCTPTSVTYTYNPKDPEEAFNVTFTGELTRSSEGGSGERPGYELTASANDDNLFVVPGRAKVAFGESQTFEAKKKNGDDAVSVSGVEWSISDDNIATISSGGTAGLSSTADPDEDATPYTVTAEKDNEEATAEFIPTAVKSISAKGKTSTADDVKTIFVAKGDSVKFKAKSQPEGGFPDKWPKWQVTYKGNVESQKRGDASLQVTWNNALKDTKDAAIVQAKCGGADDWEPIKVKVFKFKIIPVAQINRPDKTKLGIGEEVKLKAVPPLSVQWRIRGKGTLTKNKDEAYLETAMIPSSPVVRATKKSGHFSKRFNVIAPKRLTSQHDQYIGYGKVGSNLIGAKAKFKITLYPTDVSFYNATFRENIPKTLIKWPDGTKGIIRGRKEKWHPIGYGSKYDNTFPDKVGSDTVPAERLYNGDKYVPFQWNLQWVEEYKNESGKWVPFFKGETLKVKYKGNKKCRVIHEGSPSKWQGPWE